ncbi:MAG: hypothetical protein IK134_05400 [Oscillospiraceae bacterium]|nr:hypothetical protein [Oscillospiraceae bacterium]
MTLEDAFKKMEELDALYTEQKEKCTAVQREALENGFTKEHGVTFNGYGFSTKPFEINDSCSVTDVSLITKKTTVKGLFRAKAEITQVYIVRTNIIRSSERSDFHFTARLNSGAEKLTKGQTIRISGMVIGSASHDDCGPLYVALQEAEQFSIHFES